MGLDEVASVPLKEQEPHMAKRRKSRKSKAAIHVTGTHTYSGRKFGCYGKHVRSGKSRKKTARMFCRGDKKKK
jgi:hypothetical protein